MKSYFFLLKLIQQNFKFHSAFLPKGTIKISVVHIDEAIFFAIFTSRISETYLNEKFTIIEK